MHIFFNQNIMSWAVLEFRDVFYGLMLIYSSSFQYPLHRFALPFLPSRSPLKSTTNENFVENQSSICRILLFEREFRRSKEFPGRRRLPPRISLVLLESPTLCRICRTTRNSLPSNTPSSSRIAPKHPSPHIIPLSTRYQLH